VLYSITASLFLASLNSPPQFICYFLFPVQLPFVKFFQAIVIFGPLLQSVLGKVHLFLLGLTHDKPVTFFLLVKVRVRGKAKGKGKG
jgi:hypothetical protein